MEFELEKEGVELDPPPPEEREVLLSEDVIEEILVRLPIEALKRFRTVSKWWLRLISSPRFAFKHYSITKAQTFNNPSGVASFFILRIPDPHKISRHKSFITPITVNQQPHHHPVVKINQNIDLPHHHAEEEKWDLHLNWLFPAGFGIYCLFEQVKGSALLWNPTNGQTKPLPPSPYRQSINGAYVYHFAKLDYHRDEAGGGNFSYKVGRVISNYVYHHGRGGKERLTHLSLELFSSKTKSWKLIPDFCSGVFVGYADWLLHTANLNGMAHWVIRSQNEDDIFITTFDYETNVFGKIKGPSAPPGRHYDNFKCIVTSYNDKFLCLVLFFLKTNDDGSSSEFLDIWVMREYGVEDSWTKEFTVGPIPVKTEVLGFSSKLQGIFLRPRYGAPTPLLFCDCKSSTIKRYHLKTNIYQQSSSFGRRILLNLLQVVERESSLVSIE